MGAGETGEWVRTYLIALKRLDSESGLEVYQMTRDQVRPALEAAGADLLSTDNGQEVLLLYGRADQKTTRG